MVGNIKGRGGFGKGECEKGAEKEGKANVRKGGEKERRTNGYIFFCTESFCDSSNLSHHSFVKQGESLPPSPPHSSSFSLPLDPNSF